MGTSLPAASKYESRSSRCALVRLFSCSKVVSANFSLPGQKPYSLKQHQPSCLSQSRNVLYQYSSRPSCVAGLQISLSPRTTTAGLFNQCFPIGDIRRLRLGWDETAAGRLLQRNPPFLEVWSFALANLVRNGLKAFTAEYGSLSRCSAALLQIRSGAQLREPVSPYLQRAKPS